MKWFRRQPERAVANPGERVCLRFDDGSQIEFSDVADALHHVRVQGAVGVVGLVREDDGALLFDRPELDHSINEEQAS